jgi:hypothetical protein
MNTVMIANWKGKVTKRDENWKREREKRKTYHIDNLVFSSFYCKINKIYIQFYRMFAKTVFYVQTDHLLPSHV